MQSEFNLPKVELHPNLERAISPALISQTAHEKKADINFISDDKGYYVLRNATHFLEVSEAATSMLIKSMDFYALTHVVLNQSAAYGVVFTEAFISPDFCRQAKLDPWCKYLSAIQEAAQEAEKAHGNVMKQNVTCIRHFVPDSDQKSALCTAETSGNFICGFGIGCAETFGVRANYLYSFDMVREARPRLTTHAGEWGGAEGVGQAIFGRKVERLLHGMQVIDDSHLLDWVFARDITLEVCHGSNAGLGIYPDTHAHPIEKLQNQGVNITVSTDDTHFSYGYNQRICDLVLRFCLGQGRPPLH